MRTTFTEEQIQILQANFQIDSNPDGQDLERIAQVRKPLYKVLSTLADVKFTEILFENCTIARGLAIGRYSELPPKRPRV